MIIWSIVWGIVLGWLWPGHGDAGPFVGGFLGFFAGLSLRWAVRAEVEAVRKKAPPQAAPAARQAPAVLSRRVPQRGETCGFKALWTPPAATSIPATRTGHRHRRRQRSGTGRKCLTWPPTACRARSPPRRLPGAATTTRPAYTPAEPNPVELALIAAKNWFLGGNTIVRVGLVILFIGLSFLARYAASAGLFPVEFRLAAIGAAAIALLAVGFRKRMTSPASRWRCRAPAWR
jgi:hypothetical protein